LFYWFNWPQFFCCGQVWQVSEMKKYCTFAPIKQIAVTMTLLMINIKSLLLLAIVAIVAVSCARIFSKSASNAKAIAAYANLGVDEFQTFIANPVVQLLDVRTRDEFDEGHIARAWLVDVNDSTFVEQAVAVLDKQRPVAVYCRSGRRSARAANLLTGQGYQVTNLVGGVMAWQDAGKTLVK
jgi:rhodanese-related sulfurtransferase